MWTLIVELVRKFKDAQHAMERAMLSVSLDGHWSRQVSDGERD